MIENIVRKIKELPNYEQAILTHCAQCTLRGYADNEKLFEEAYNILDSLLPQSGKTKHCVNEDAYQMVLDHLMFQTRFPHQENPKFTFIDLFAGIGGFRLAMQALGGKCVFSSEWDSNAQQTYLDNFGEMPFGDITKESTKSFIPKTFDVLCAGFPCQAFSIAGYQKGFDDTRGTLFFDVAEIIKRHRPKAVFLENVKNLAGHDQGRTFKTILKVLEEDLNYKVFYKIMSPSEYANVPQNRERIFIICFDRKILKKPDGFIFNFPEKVERTKLVKDCVNYSEKDPSLFYTEKNFSHYSELISDMKNKDTIYQWRRQYVRENKNNLCPTLTANMGTGGHNVPLILTDKGIRKLSPRECLNFQGFPPEYKFPHKSKAPCYKQAGNSVAVPLIQRVAEKMIEVIC